MKLKAIRAHLVDGKPVAVGDLYDVSDWLGNALISWGKAEPAPGAPPRQKRGAMTTESAAALTQGAGQKEADHD